MPGRRFHRLARSWCFALALMAGTLAARSAVAITVVACVGDSITAGGWPADLGRRLGTNYQAINYGVGGTTLLKNGDSPYWNTPAFTQSHASGPGVVVIMLGTNDSKPQNWGPHKAEFVGDYGALIDTYSALPSHPKIFLNLCPPAGNTNAYAISGTVIENEIVPLIRQVAAAKGAGIIDVFSAFGGHNFDPTLYGADLVHPNGAGAQRIADTVFVALEVALDGGVVDGATDARAVDATIEASAQDAAGFPPSVDATVETGGPSAVAGSDAAVSRDAAVPIGPDGGGSAIQSDVAGDGGALALDSATPASGGTAPAATGGGGSGCSLSVFPPFGAGAPNDKPGAAPNDKPGACLLLALLATLALRRRRRALAYIGNWG